MVSLLRSLHEGMKAEVTMDGQVAPEFEVCRLEAGVYYRSCFVQLLFQSCHQPVAGEMQRFWCGYPVQVWWEVDWRKDQKTLLHQDV